MLERLSPNCVVNLKSVLSAKLYFSEVSSKWAITLQIGSEEYGIITENCDFDTKEEAESALDKLAPNNNIFDS